LVAGHCDGSCRRPKKNVKPEAAITVFELLMMGGVSPKHVEQLRNIEIINSTTLFHLDGSFCDLYYDVRIHEHQINQSYFTTISKVKSECC
jgi:hypothetical protein